MFTKRFLTVLLASTAVVSLTACAALPLGALGSLNAQQTAAARAMIDDSVASMQTDVDMSLAAALADDANLKVQGLAFESAAGTRERDRFERFKERAKPRLQKARDAVRTVDRVETPTEDGGKIVKVTMAVNHRNGVQNRVVERAYAADGSLIEATVHFEMEQRNGSKMVGDRHRKLEADNTWHATFKYVITRRDGKVKTVEWTRVEAADGSETGDGKITRFDGSVVTIAITKSADGTVVTRTQDSSAKLEAEITQPEASTEASVTVTDGSNGQVAATTTVPDTEAVEPSNQ
ncbi:hypothetical protein D3C86_956770 [compost metagenome]